MAKTMDVQLVNPFLHATVECLRKMGGYLPERRRMFIKTSTTMHGEFAGVIGLSNGLTGSCVVSFPEALARDVVGRMLGLDPIALERDLLMDGVGEVANMVSGGAKRLLAGSRYSFDIGTPTMLYGNPINLYNPPDTVSIAVELAPYPKTEATFMVELAIKPPAD